MQIVDEQGEGVLGPGEDVEETPEYLLKSILTFLRRKLGDRRLLSDNESKLRDEADHELPVWAHCIEQHVTPSGNLFVVLAEDLSH